MHYSIIMGRKGSKGFPGKNLFLIGGKPLAAYVFENALKVDALTKHFLSTDDPELAQLALSYGISVIDRPDDLQSDQALGEDVYKHAFEYIKDNETVSEQSCFVLLMCNSPIFKPWQINEGLNLLANQPDLDSAVTVSKYNMWSPLRARRLDENQLLKPFVPFESFGDPKSLSCDRDSQGDVYFADMGASIVKSRCLEHIENGLLPQKWMGQNIAPIFQEGGFDLDYEWQLPALEHWIRENA